MEITNNIKEMLGIGTPIRTQHDLFMHGLKDIYYGEKYLVDALDEMAAEASSVAIRNAFRQHRDETRTHVQRIERVFSLLETEPEEITCQAIRGLVSEGKEITAEAEPGVVDAGLIFAAQAVEHYEVARYSALIRMADDMGHTNVSKLLQQNLADEEKTIRLLDQMQLEGSQMAPGTRNKNMGQKARRM